MFNLMKLELQHNRMKSYISAALIIVIVMVGFLYLFAALPYLDETQTDLEMFMTYGSIATLVCMLSMVSFSILSSVMYARFVVEEYAGKKAILLSSYPVNRRRILWAKVTVVFLFTVLSMFLSGLVTFALFYATELFIPICKDALTISTIFKTIALVLVYSLMSGTLAVVSLWFGLWKKSTPAPATALILNEPMGGLNNRLCQHLELSPKYKERLTVITFADKSGGRLCFLIGQSGQFIYMERRGRL